MKMVVLLTTLAVFGVAVPALAAEGVTSTPIASATKTWTGQPIRMPDGPVQVTVQTIDIADGGRLPVHEHPWPRLAYVLAGRLRVTNVETGAVREFAQGEVIVEAIGQWHKAEALAATRLLVIDHTPPGATATVIRPGP